MAKGDGLEIEGRTALHVEFHIDASEMKHWPSYLIGQYFDGIARALTAKARADQELAKIIPEVSNAR